MLTWLREQQMDQVQRPTAEVTLLKDPAAVLFWSKDAEETEVVPSRCSANVRAWHHWVHSGFLCLPAVCVASCLLGSCQGFFQGVWAAGGEAPAGRTHF